MLEQLLNDIGEELVVLIRKEIMTPRDRFTKRPEQPKRPPRYNFNATGSLYRSVQYEVIDEQIYILMNDYGADYVFGTGSKPSKPPGKVARESIQKWVEKKLRRPPREAKRIAFAISRRLHKVGYKGYNLFNEEFNNGVYSFVDNLLERPEYQDAILREQLGDIFDRINLLGEQTFNIALGRV
jgi:hypothetical protein